MCVRATIAHCGKGQVGDGQRYILEICNPQKILQMLYTRPAPTGLDTLQRHLAVTFFGISTWTVDFDAVRPMGGHSCHSDAALVGLQELQLEAEFLRTKGYWSAHLFCLALVIEKVCGYVCVCVSEDMATGQLPLQENMRNRSCVTFLFWSAAIWK